MTYTNVSRAVFLSRPNRFTAEVMAESGEVLRVHVKNTGRCRELLVKGRTVYIEHCPSPSRRTDYDLIAAEKPGSGIFNIDSLAPNRLVGEWLAGQGFDTVKPEYRYGDSRIDFYTEKGGVPSLIEVKGCTLEVDGTGYFPDAPTVRGARHLRELTAAAMSGISASAAFVLQAECIKDLLPNRATDPAFAEAFENAREHGVKVMLFFCSVAPDRITVRDVEIR